MAKSIEQNVSDSFMQFTDKLLNRDLVPFEIALEQVKKLASKYNTPKNTILHAIRSRNVNMEDKSLHEVSRSIDKLLDRISQNIS